jgi:hypothetical protein
VLGLGAPADIIPPNAANPRKQRRKVFIVIFLSSLKPT